VLVKVTRVDPQVVALANRHYSRDHPSTSVGSPARLLVLGDALGRVAFVWSWPRDGYRKDGQNGANCELFRREGGPRASALLLEAEQWVRQTWPDVRRLFTYVDPTRVRSRNPGYCFLCAGWHREGVSAAGKLLLVKGVPCSSR